MINVSIVVSNYRHTQGVNSVVDQYLKNRELFREQGINICKVYDCSGCYEQIPTRGAGSTDGQVTGSILQRLKRSFLYKTRFGQCFTVLYRYILVGYRAYRQYRKNNCGEDVLISQDGVMSYFHLKNRQKAKMIFMTHIHKMEGQQLLMNYPKLKGSALEKWMGKMRKFTYVHADGIVTICSEAKAVIRRENDCVEPLVIYNSVPDPGIATQPGTHEKVRFVMASSLTTVKGIDFFIEALGLLPGEIMERAEFHVYGNGEYYTVLEEACRTGGYTNVQLYGNQPAPFKNYGDKDVFLSMSRKETMPMSIVEAMSVGLPVFASDVGAISEMVLDGQTGKVFSVGAAPLAEAIVYAVEHKEALPAMGSLARERYCGKFSNLIWVDSFSKLIHEITEQK